MPTMNSPLGKYAPIVAALTCGGIIALYGIALLFNRFLMLDGNTMGQLQTLALVAFGAITGSAVAVNGWKQPLASAHDRIDKLEIATKTITHDPSTSPGNTQNIPTA